LQLQPSGSSLGVEAGKQSAWEIGFKVVGNEIADTCKGKAKDKLYDIGAYYLANDTSICKDTTSIVRKLTDIKKNYQDNKGNGGNFIAMFKYFVGLINDI
jgi:hypothetical protein